jgi:putative oxidoreductase
MKTASYGRLVFGTSAVLFGVIALMWHDLDTWQSMHRILRLPLGTILGDCLMIALIAGGIGLIYPRTRHLASIVLVIVCALFSLACVPGIFAAPTVYVQYGAFFEQFSLVCGALAAYAATEPNATRSAALGRAARVGLGLCAISFTLAQIFYLRFTASLVPTWIPPNQMFWAILTTIAFALAAIAILSNRQARLATNLMTLMLALFGVLVWVPRLIAQPQAHGNWSEFALNFLITGAAWMVADSLRSVPAQVRPNHG